MAEIPYGADTDLARLQGLMVAVIGHPVLCCARPSKSASARGSTFDAPTHFVPPPGYDLPFAGPLGDETGDRVPPGELTRPAPWWT
jgi:hypothetical protein